jgi:hypothetical protein
MLDSALDLARTNFSHDLDRQLGKLPAEGDEEARALFNISFDYRVLGLCALLLEADVPYYAECLIKSGQARLHFLRRAGGGEKYSEPFLCTSKSIASVAALAAGDRETATAIAERSPQVHFPGVEYEDDFLFYHFLHRCLTGESDAGLAALAGRWEEVLEGQGSGYLDACKGLLGDEKEFDAAFTSLIEHRERQFEIYQESPSFDASLFATEGKVFVEGVAVLQVAGLRGISTRDEYRLAPSLAKVPMGTHRLDEEAWRSGVSVRG